MIILAGLTRDNDSTKESQQAELEEKALHGLLMLVVVVANCGLLLLLNALIA